MLGLAFKNSLMLLPNSHDNAAARFFTHRRLPMPNKLTAREHWPKASNNLAPRNTQG